MVKLVTTRHVKHVYDQLVSLSHHETNPTSVSQEEAKDTICPLGGAAPAFTIQEVSQTLAVGTSSALPDLCRNVMPHVGTLSSSLEVMARPSSDASTSKDRPSSKQSAISEQ